METTKANVLVVEDDTLTAIGFKEILTQIGYGVPAISSSGEDAIKKAELHKPDVILMDIMLEGELGGVEAADQIRARFGIPVIFLTSYIDDALLRRARVTDPFGYLIKPCHPRELYATIELAIFKHHESVYREAVEEELRRSRQELETILQGLSEGVTVQSPSGQLVYANEVAARQIGYSSVAELMGVPLPDLMNKFEIAHEDGTPLAPDDLPGRRAIVERQTVAATLRYRDKETNENRWSFVKSSPVFHDTGEVRLAINVFHDITEQKRSEEQLKSEYAFRRAVETSVSSGIATVDLSGRQTYVNPAFTQMVGWDASDLVDQVPPFKYWPLEERENIEKALQATLRGDAPSMEFELRFQRKNGEIFDAGVVVSPLRTDDGVPSGWLASVTDITGRKKFEKGERFLVEAGAQIGSSLDYHVTLANVAKLAVPTLADWCTIDIQEEDETLQRVAVAHRDPTKVHWVEEMHGLFPPDVEGPYGVLHVIQTGKTEFFREITGSMIAESVKQPRQLETLRGLNPRSVIITPLVARGRTLGAITLVASDSGRRFEETDVAVAEQLAFRAAVAVDNSRLYREAELEINERKQLQEKYKIRAAQQAAVAELGQFALSGVQLQTLLDYAAELLCKTLNVEFCKVLQLLPGGKKFLLRAGHGWRDGLVGIATFEADSRSQANYTLQANEPVIVDDLRKEKRFSGPSLLHDHNVISGLGVIIKGGSLVWGVLSAHTAIKRDFVQDDINFVQSVANVLAQAIERNKAHTELERSYEVLEHRVKERTESLGQANEELRLLQVLGIAIAESESIQSALEITLQKICEITGWVLGHAWQLAPERKHIKCTASWQADTDVMVSPQENSLLALDDLHSLPGRVWATKKAVWLADLQIEKQLPYQEWAVSAGMKAAMAVPILNGDEVVAVLEFFLRQPKIRDKRLINLVATVSVQLGVVLHRKTIEEKLRTSEMELAEAQEVANVGSWRWEIGPNVITWSDELYRIFGLKPGKTPITYETYLHLVHPDDRDYVKNVITETFLNEQQYTFRIIRPDGTHRIIQARGRTVRDDFAKPIRVIGIGQDITERRMAEDELHKRDVQLTTAQQIAHLGSWEYDLKSGSVTWSDELYRIYGRTRETFGGTADSFMECVHPDDRTETGRSIQQAIETKEPFSFEERIIRPDGTVRVLQSQGRVSTDTNHEAVRLIGVCLDITDRKKAEEKFRGLLESAPDAIVIVNQSSDIVLVNAQAENIFGYTRGDLLGKPVKLLLPQGFPKYQENLKGKTQQPMGAGFDLKGIKKDGTEFPVEISISPLETEEGVLITGAIRDITEQRRLQQQLFETERQRSADLRQYAILIQRAQEDERQRISRELHDDLCQRLSAMKLSMDMLEEDTHPGNGKTAQAFQTFGKDIETIINEVRRMSHNLRPSALDDFGLVIALKSLSQEFEKHHKIKIVFEGDDRSIMHFDTHVEIAVFRIVQESLSNIAKHSRASRVLIELIQNEEWIDLSIQDNGNGFQHEHGLSARGNNGGLGLVSMRERSEQLGGIFEILSTRKKGTTIHVRIPLRKAHALIENS